MQTCMYGNLHSHQKALDTPVAMSDAPEPAAVLQAVQTLPVHLVPRKSDILTHKDFSGGQHTVSHHFFTRGSLRQGLPSTSTS